jgi:3-isopropylmalate/(R)-2-methylmalate dehydratase large subunit
MGYEIGDKMLGKKIDFVFLGSCTNGRIEDFRTFSKITKGFKKASNITAWLVPGSHRVLNQIKSEGILADLESSGFKVREPGCSACLAMNDDKIPPGKYVISTSNRNFEGRQGQGSFTHLVSPAIAAASAIAGRISGV